MVIGSFGVYLFRNEPHSIKLSLDTIGFGSCSHVKSVIENGGTSE